MHRVETFIALSSCIDYSVAYYLCVLTSLLWSSLTWWSLCLSRKEQACQALQPNLQERPGQPGFNPALPSLPFPVPVILAKAGAAVFLLVPALRFVHGLGFSRLSVSILWGCWLSSIPAACQGKGVSVPVHSLDLSLIWQHLLQISRWGHCSLLTAA